MKSIMKLGAAALAGALTMGLFTATAAFSQDQQQDAPEASEHADQRHERREARRAAMAAELGVDVETLHDAVVAAHESVRDQLGPVSQDPTDEELDARRAAFKEALAAELGTDVATLEQAGRNVANARLDEAVANGRITEERAAEIREAIENGTLRDQIRDRWHARRGD
jgi:anti-sigma28 factor (negative regulator of flagellin synthesis)